MKVSLAEARQTFNVYRQYAEARKKGDKSQILRVIEGGALELIDRKELNLGQRVVRWFGGGNASLTAVRRCLAKGPCLPLRFEELKGDPYSSRTPDWAERYQNPREMATLSQEEFEEMKDAELGARKCLQESLSHASLSFSNDWDFHRSDKIHLREARNIFHVLEQYTAAREKGDKSKILRVTEVWLEGNKWINSLELIDRKELTLGQRFVRGFGGGNASLSAVCSSLRAPFLPDQFEELKGDPYSSITPDWAKRYQNPREMATLSKEEFEKIKKVDGQMRKYLRESILHMRLNFFKNSFFERDYAGTYRFLFSDKYSLHEATKIFHVFDQFITARNEGDKSKIFRVIEKADGDEWIKSLELIDRKERVGFGGTTLDDVCHFVGSAAPALPSLFSQLQEKKADWAKCYQNSEEVAQLSKADFKKMKRAKMGVFEHLQSSASRVQSFFYRFTHFPWFMKQVPKEKIDLFYGQGVHEPIGHFSYKKKNDASILLKYRLPWDHSIPEGFRGHWNKIGFCHEYGIGTEKDPEKAREYYEKAAKETLDGRYNHFAPWINLGRLSLQKGNKTEAIEQFIRAKGILEAVIQEYGKGPAKDGKTNMKRVRINNEFGGIVYCERVLKKLTAELKHLEKVDD